MDIVFIKMQFIEPNKGKGIQMGITENFKEIRLKVKT